MPIAYSYLRFSTPEQLKGDSLRRQLELSEKYAAEHGLELDTTLKLRDLGLSAYHKVNVERGALGVFFEAIKDGRVKPGSYLLVESLDRLSRAKVLDAQRMFQDIILAGITIVTLTDGMVYSEKTIGDNFGQLMYSVVIMSRAHDESHIKSKRIAASWENKRRQADTKIMTKMAPSWLKVEDGKFVVVEEKAEIVREIFRLLRNGYGLDMIERKFNQEGIPTISRASRWHKTYIFKMTQNKSVIGEFQPKTGRPPNVTPVGDVINGYYPAIISEEEFYAAKSAMQARSTSGGRKGKGIANVFSGLCKCGYCGGTMRYIDKGKNSIYQYLGCTNAKSGLACKYVTWQYQEFENCLLSKLSGLDIGAVLEDDGAERAKNQLVAERAKLEDVQMRLKKLVRIAEMTEDIEDISVRLSELSSEEKELKRSVAELEATTQLPKLARKHFQQFQRLRTALDTASEEERIELRLRINNELKRLLDRIEIYPDGAEPWSSSMTLIGVKPGKEGRFAVAVFKSGDGRVLHGVNSMTTLWPGPSTEEGISNAHLLNIPKKTRPTLGKADDRDE